MTNRTDRALRWAMKAASFSGNDYYHVGAAILRGSKLVSLGWNTHKTHPKSKTRFHGTHAEFKAIQGNDKEDLIGTTIYVVRKTPGGKLSMARPCEECAALIRAVGIARVYYTDRDGVLVEDD